MVTKTVTKRSTGVKLKTPLLAAQSSKRRVTKNNKDGKIMPSLLFCDHLCSLDLTAALVLSGTAKRGSCLSEVALLQVEVQHTHNIVVVEVAPSVIACVGERGGIRVVSEAIKQPADHGDGR